MRLVEGPVALVYNVAAFADQARPTISDEEASLSDAVVSVHGAEIELHIPTTVFEVWIHDELLRPFGFSSS